MFIPSKSILWTQDEPCVSCPFVLNDPCGGAALCAPVMRGCRSVVQQLQPLHLPRRPLEQFARKLDDLRRLVIAEWRESLARAPDGAVHPDSGL